MSHDKRASLSTMALAALGVVYGDIGTSPLYTLQECFKASQIPVEADNIFGFLSLIFWSIIMVVTVKYVLFVMRADNKGEGGVVVMMQQAVSHLRGKMAWVVMMFGLIGSALFYGDAVITPAISVLSAAEGLKVLNPAFEHYVLPIALAVLVLLFIGQKYGTQKIGVFFGPIMATWFVVLGIAGLWRISQAPEVIKSLNPLFAIQFITHHGFSGFASFGSVVLALTGAEALYADMGHFGRKPIQTAWFALVLPALVLNYFGQGGLLLHNSAAIENPFFLVFPSWALIPIIILATMATVIASQAVISGAYSLTREAIQLGFAPRMKIHHTSAAEKGQIYMPTVNWLLLAVVLGVILTFKSSANLAAAYGIAVTGTMILSTLMFSVVMYKNWRWPLYVVGPLTMVFLSFDTVFFSANLMKIVNGGWLPLLLAGVVMVIFTTWRRGRTIINEELQAAALPLDGFVENIEEFPPQEVAGTAIYMVSDPYSVPKALLHNLKHNKILHERNVLLTVKTLDVPFVAEEERLSIEPLSPHFMRMMAHYGFQESPDVEHILHLANQQGFEFELMNTSFFLSHDNLMIGRRGKISRLRAHLFAWLSKNGARATDYYRIPDNRVVELGSQVSI